MRFLTVLSVLSLVSLVATPIAAGTDTPFPKQNVNGFPASARAALSFRGISLDMDGDEAYKVLRGLNAGNLTTATRKLAIKTMTIPMRELFSTVSFPSTYQLSFKAPGGSSEETVTLGLTSPACGGRVASINYLIKYDSNDPRQPSYAELTSQLNGKYGKPSQTSLGGGRDILFWVYDGDKPMPNYTGPGWAQAIFTAYPTIDRQKQYVENLKIKISAYVRATLWSGIASQKVGQFQLEIMSAAMALSCARKDADILKAAQAELDGAEQQRRNSSTVAPPPL